MVRFDLTPEEIHKANEKDLFNGLSTKQIKYEDFLKAKSNNDSYFKGVFNSEDVTDGEAFLKNNIPDDGGLLSGKQSTTPSAVRDLAIDDIKAAKAANPATNSMKWAQSNLPRYKSLVKKEKVKKLDEIGMVPNIITTAEGDIDSVKTMEKIAVQVRDKGLSIETAKSAKRIIDGIMLKQTQTKGMK
jgi:hypothetical protein